MRLWVAVVAMSLAAGCSGTEVPVPGQEAPADECPLLYPDNSTFDCASPSLIRDGIGTTRPGTETGWFCHTHNENDDGYGVLDLLMRQDGRLAFWWDSTWTKPGGVMFTQVSIYYNDGTGDVAVVEFQPSGFVELPFRSKGTIADLHLLVRHHVLDLKVGDGDWYEDKNATIMVGGFGGDPWYVWAYEAGGTTRHLDTMVHAPADGATWLVRNQFYEAEDHAAYATASAMGAKFLQRPMAFDPTRHASCEL